MRRRHQQGQTAPSSNYEGLVSDVTAPTIAVGRALDALRAEWARQGVVLPRLGEGASNQSDSDDSWTGSSQPGRGRGGYRSRRNSGFGRGGVSTSVPMTVRENRNGPGYAGPATPPGGAYNPGSPSGY